MDAKTELLKKLELHLSAIAYCSDVQELENEVAFIVNDLNRFKYNGIHEDVARTSFINALAHYAGEARDVTVSKAQIIKLMEIEIYVVLPALTVSLSIILHSEQLSYSKYPQLSLFKTLKG